MVRLVVETVRDRIVATGELASEIGLYYYIDEHRVLSRQADRIRSIMLRFVA